MMVNKKLTIFLFLTAVSCTSREPFIIGTRDKIRHDDFEYYVSSYMVSRFLKSGRDTLKADGMFYLVSFRTDNLAKRVSHEWDNSIAVIVDEKGREFANRPDIQRFWENAIHFGLMERYSTPAGKSDSTVLAFDLPFDVIKPCLKVRGEILMGDIFDRARFRRTLIKLF